MYNKSHQQKQHKNDQKKKEEKYTKARKKENGSETQLTDILYRQERETGRHKCKYN